jgi:hypothetical protein
MPRCSAAARASRVRRMPIGRPVVSARKRKRKSHPLFSAIRLRPFRPGRLRTRWAEAGELPQKVGRIDSEQERTQSESASPMMIPRIARPNSLHPASRANREPRLSQRTPHTPEQVRHCGAWQTSYAITRGVNRRAPRSAHRQTTSGPGGKCEVHTWKGFFLEWRDSRDVRH